MEEQYVKNVYETIANNFSSTRFSKWNWITDFVISKPLNSNILDIGCGNGRNMLYEGYNFTGIDNCENFIKICINRGLNVLAGDMTNIPFKDNSFDYIICIASFHHLSTIERRQKALKEMKRILKPGGEILISVWSINQEHNKKLNFKYGNNMIPWKDKKTGKIEQRYYYIFEKSELTELISQEFQIKNWNYEHGNEILTLTY